MTHEYPVLCAMGDACRSPDHGGPRPTHRAWVCDECTDWTAHNLRVIADAWEDLTDALLDAGNPGGERGRQRHGAVSRTFPYNERAASARRQAAAHIWFLVRTLCECRPTTALPDAVDIPTLARWLADWHTPSLVARPGRYTATTVVENTASITRRVRSAAYPQTVIRRAPTGIACDTPDCAGGYLAMIGAGIATDLVCDADPGHTVPPSVWQRHRWVRTHRPIDLTRLVQGVRP